MRIAGVSVGAGGKRFAGQTEHWRTKERPIYSRASFFSKGSLSFVSRMLTCTSLFSRFFSNAHYHGLLPQQLGVV